MGSCSTFRNELSEETHALTKQETFLGRDAQVESRDVREPGRPPRHVTRNLRVGGGGASFQVSLASHLAWLIFGPV